MTKGCTTRRLRARAGAHGLHRPAAHGLAGEPRGQRLAAEHLQVVGRRCEEREVRHLARLDARHRAALELVAPRRRVLEATMHAWSAATPAGGVTADVVIIPHRSGNRRQRRLRALAGKREGKARADQRCRSRPAVPIPTFAPGPTPRRISTRSRSATAPRRTGARGSPPRTSTLAALPALLAARRCGWRALQRLVARLGRRQDSVVARGRRTVVRRVVRGLLPARATRVERTAPARPRGRRREARAERVAGVQHDRADHRVGEAERIRHALGAPRLVGRRKRRDRQRHRHDHDARGDAHSQDRVSASEAHDSRRPLERRGGRRHRLVGVRGRSSGGPQGAAGAVQPGQRHRRDRHACRRTASSTPRRRSRAGCRACRRT